MTSPPISGAARGPSSAGSARKGSQSTASSTANSARFYAWAHELDAWWANRGAGVSSPPAAEPAPPSLAVLPFAGLSQQQDQQYFCDGIAEELTLALGKIGGLRVCSRMFSFRFRGGAVPARAIARQLKVGALLGGSVRHPAGRLRILVTLVDPESDSQLWSNVFDRELGDVFAIHDREGVVG